MSALADYPAPPPLKSGHIIFCNVNMQKIFSDCFHFFLFLKISYFKCLEHEEIFRLKVCNEFFLTPNLLYFFLANVSDDSKKKKWQFFLTQDYKLHRISTKKWLMNIFQQFTFILL